MGSFACGDPRAVPSVAAPPNLQAELDSEDSGSNSSGRGGSKGGGKAAGPTPQEQQEELAAQALALARRGGEAALQSMARQAGIQLQQRLPKLWELASAPLAALQQQGAAADLQAAVQALHVLAVLAPAVHADLAPQLAALLPLAALCLQHANAALKLAAARAVAALAQAHTQALMPAILRLLAPLLVGGCWAVVAGTAAAGSGCNWADCLGIDQQTRCAHSLGLRLGSPPHRSNRPRAQAAPPTTPAWARCWRCTRPCPGWAWPWCPTPCWWWCR